MGGGDTSLIFANAAAGALVNISFVVAIVMCLILSVKAYKKNGEGSGVLLGLAGFAIFLTPLAVAAIAMSNNVGTGVNLLNVLDNISVLGLFSASKLVAIDIVLVLWLMFIGFSLRKVHN